MLAIRHNRSTCENVLFILQENAKNRAWRERRATRAIQHRIRSIQAAMILRWKEVSHGWRLCRLRLHGHLRKWAMADQSRALATWRAAVTRLAAIGRGLHRILSARGRAFRAAPFRAWVHHVDLQTRRKNALTRIVLRVQDRGLAAALRAWCEQFLIALLSLL